jgi:hypothetical protein
MYPLLLNVEPLNVSAVPLVIVEPLKKFRPFVTWVLVPVPPFAIERSLTRLRVPKDALVEKRFVEEAVVAKKVLEVALVRKALADVVLKKLVCDCQYAALVVENANPWLSAKKAEADVVENALPVFAMRKADADVVEK